jgi:hypothetical protein
MELAAELDSGGRLEESDVDGSISVGSVEAVAGAEVGGVVVGDVVGVGIDEDGGSGSEFEGTLVNELSKLSKSRLNCEQHSPGLRRWSRGRR